MRAGTLLELPLYEPFVTTSMLGYKVTNQFLQQSVRGFVRSRIGMEDSRDYIRLELMEAAVLFDKISRPVSPFHISSH